MKPTMRVIGIAAASLVAGALLVPVAVGANSRRDVGSKANDAAAERTLTAVLSGANETTPGDPDGAGAATVTVDVLAQEVCVDAAALNLEPIVADHIHEGAAGANGPVVIDFGGTLSDCVDVPDAALLGRLVANPAGFYFNIHTQSFPAGAIRGNLAVHAEGSGGLHLLAEPLRAYDSREGTAPKKLAADETRTVNLWFGKDGAGATKLAVPPGASGALVTVTVTDTEVGGFVKVYSAALTTAPATSSINWSADGQNLAVSTSVAVSDGADIKLTGGSHSTNVVIDVVGYYF